MVHLCSPFLWTVVSDKSVTGLFYMLQRDKVPEFFCQSAPDFISFNANIILAFLCILFVSYCNFFEMFVLLLEASKQKC